MIVLTTSCKHEDITHLDITVIQDIGGAGMFKAINMGTNDTLTISGGISINIGGEEPELVARNGNIIKLVFERAEKYKNYDFNTTFILHNDSTITNRPVYEYAIENTRPGTYRISMSAKHEADDNININGGGSFNLVIVE